MVHIVWSGACVCVFFLHSLSQPYECDTPSRVITTHLPRLQVQSLMGPTTCAPRQRIRCGAANGKACDEAGTQVLGSVASNTAALGTYHTCACQYYALRNDRTCGCDRTLARMAEDVHLGASRPPGSAREQARIGGALERVERTTPDDPRRRCHQRKSSEWGGPCGARS